MTAGPDTALGGLSACSSRRGAARAEVRTDVHPCLSLVVSVHQHAMVGHTLCTPSHPPLLSGASGQNGERRTSGVRSTGRSGTGQGCPADFVQQVIMTQVVGEG